MKLNLGLPIIRFDGKPARFPSGDIERLGEALSMIVGNAQVPENKLNWVSKTAKKMAECGVLELPPSEIGDIAKMIPAANIATWSKGPLLFLLEEKVEDAEALANYHEWYGETPHVSSPAEVFLKKEGNEVGGSSEEII